MYLYIVKNIDITRAVSSSTIEHFFLEDESLLWATLSRDGGFSLSREMVGY